jgi:hypothetical protein
MNRGLIGRAFVTAHLEYPGRNQDHLNAALGGHDLGRSGRSRLALPPATRHDQQYKDTKARGFHWQRLETHYFLHF